MAKVCTLKETQLARQLCCAPYAPESGGNVRFGSTVSCPGSGYASTSCLIQFHASCTWGFSLHTRLECHYILVRGHLLVSAL